MPETTARRVALLWLVQERGLSSPEALEVMDGVCSPASAMGRLRQEANNVARFVETMNDAK